MPTSNPPPPQIPSLISAISPFLFLRCAMQEKDNLHRSGICQRIINFITGLVFPGLKRITDHTASVHDPLANGVGSVVQHQHPKSLSKPRDAEIEIHFKQSDEEDLEWWIHVDKLDSSVHSEEDYQVQFNKGHNISSSSSAMPSDKVSGKRSKVTESPREKEVQLPIVDVHGSSPHQGTKKANQPTQQQKKGEKAPNLTSLAQGRSPQNDSSRNKNTENRASEDSIVPIEIQKPRMRPHLLDVAPNINEKTDAFLKIKKENMRRNLGSEPEES